MRIQLDHYYQGAATNNLPIAPGEYDASDDALYGAASYLIDTGHAVVVGGDPFPPPQDVLDESAVDEFKIEEDDPPAETEANERPAKKGRK